MFERVADGLGKQKDRLKLSLESPVADPLMTIGNFNRQFALGEMEKSAVEWAWPQEAGRDHVSCGQHVYQSCCHGGIAGGIELSSCRG